MFTNILIINFIILTIQEFNFAKATTSGFDSVQNITTETFTQAKSSANFFIGRVFNGALYDIPSDGPSLESAVDQAGIQNIANANSAGLDVDAYFVPRYAQLYENIDAQIDYTLKAINDANLQIKTIWVVISSNLRSGWTENAQSNVDCLTRFLTQFKNINNNFQIGIATRQDELEEITGTAGDIGASKPNAGTPLWWKNCNGSATFNAFAGWGAPTITQTQCGIQSFGIDKVNMDVKN